MASPTLSKHHNKIFFYTLILNLDNNIVFIDYLSSQIDIKKLWYIHGNETFFLKKKKKHKAVMVYCRATMTV